MIGAEFDRRIMVQFFATAIERRMKPLDVRTGPKTKFKKMLKDGLNNIFGLKERMR
jgi:hypothetical protein